MFQETFSLGNSLLHKSDPRIKIILVILYIIAIVINNNIISVVFLFFCSLFFIFLSKLPISIIIKRLLMVNTFVLFLWLFLPFSTQGKNIFTIYKFNATLEGIIYALLITLKTNSCVLAIIAFISTSPIPVIGHALYKLKLPDKLILLFLLTYRYLDVIFSEFSRLYNAALIRSFIPKTNLHTYKTISYMVAMVLIKAYERGKRVYEAMLLRGFNGKFYSLQQLKISKVDLIITLITLFFIVLSSIPHYTFFSPLTKLFSNYAKIIFG